MDSEHLCMGCMADKGDLEYCPGCGRKEGTPAESPLQLPPRTVLVGRYLLGRVLGQGGFGITYLAWDLNLNRKLAVKEYFPREVCGRGRDEVTVRPLSQRSVEAYNYGLGKFVEEGRALAHFRDHPGIVTLLDFLEANGTAYIVMAYVEGVTFEQYLNEHGGKLSFEAALDILVPVMDALREVHRAGMLHRDVSPSNIYLDKNRQVRILDFGATRYAMREQSQSLTVLFKPGYTPFEQYSSRGKQGAWTDVYALGATFYTAITGQTPAEAPDRSREDNLTPPSRLGAAIPPDAEAALMKALAVHAEDRYQTIEEFQKEVLSRCEPKPGSAPPNFVNRYLLAAACLLILTSVGSAVMWYRAHARLRSLHLAVADLERKLSSGQSGVESALQAARLNVSRLEKERDDLKTQLTGVSADRDALKKQLSDVSSLLKRRNLDLAQAGQKASDLQNQVTNLLAANRALETNQDTLTGEVSSLSAENQKLKHQQVARLSITAVSLFNYDAKGRKLLGNSSSNIFQSGKLQYILCQVAGPNPLFGTGNLMGAIGLRYVGPDGVARGSTVANVQGMTVKMAVTASRTDQSWRAYTIWGSDKPGAFSPGIWRIDFFQEQKKIYQKKFQVE